MPSRIDIPLSGSAPGNGSAGLDGDVPRNAALAVRMLRYERVPVLDKQTGRPQEGPVMVGGKPLRNPDGSVEIVYAQMNDLELEVLFDNPDDQLTLRFETAPTQQANW